MLGKIILAITVGFLLATSAHAGSYALYGDIEEPAKYRKLINELGDLKKGDLYTIRIMSFGGRIDSADNIVAAIDKSKGVVHCHVENYAMSAAALVLWNCDSISGTNNAIVLVHTSRFDSESILKHYEILTATDLKGLARDLMKVSVYMEKYLLKDMLTTEEIKKYYNDEDVVLTIERVEERHALKVS